VTVYHKKFNKSGKFRKLRTGAFFIYSGKKGTAAIERDNSNTRHNSGRFTRRTKIVSKSKEMVDISIKLWYHMNIKKIFESFQRVALSIFT